MFRIFVQGVVQGVGFRPYIYRKAREHALVGTVKNVGNGVEIIINDKKFIDKLTDLPPLAKIVSYTVQPSQSKKKYSDFSILKSSFSQGETLLPPDIFMCDDCRKELNTKNNRRYKYYFITCTNCGPRYSMIEDYPYDRPYTSMNDFTMCPTCHKEYTDPLDRRYHAQTIACKECGPQLHLLQNDKKQWKNLSGKTDSETIRKAVKLISQGEMLSIKGVGGFHTCSLCTEPAVAKIRVLFHRPHKPYAVMVKDILMAKQIAHLSSKEQELLLSPQRPIVVVSKKNKDVFLFVSELDSVGIMLPYTALHYLLFDYIHEPLVMTSCNLPGDPVATTETIGAYFLTHDRRIVNRCDDSVVKVNQDSVFFLRRSRGYTPLPVQLPIVCRETIAAGAEMNNVICTTKKTQCFLSQYIGDTSKYDTFVFLKDTTNKLVKYTRLKPELIACDLHPAYQSTHFARELAETHHADLVQVQHHKAHVASVAGEWGFTEYLGIAMDGLGFGDDGKIWGGEVFYVKNGREFTRIGHLEEQPLLGGDSAVLHPKKMLFGILSKILSEEQLVNYGLFHKRESQVLLHMLHHQFNSISTTSSGRILDAAAAFLQCCDERTYDGRPAMKLESIATMPLEIDIVFSKNPGKTVVMTTPLFEFLMNNKRCSKGRLAATVHMYLAKGLFEIAQKISIEKGLPIVFSGGVAYNKMISGFMRQQGVFVNRELPAGDGGICYGQAYLANLEKDPWCFF